MGERRRRPALHFTAASGWTNDPHGIVVVDGGYRMFFQHNPRATAWSERCHWGTAVSGDLIVWREEKIALSPQRGEIGCWSGSCVVTDEGPVAVYTRICGADWGRGEVALARPGPDGSWVADPPESVLAGPPLDLDVVAFRDPQVRPREGGWTAVLGAGLVGQGGCALQ